MEKRGRPKSDSAREKRYLLKLTKNEFDRLSHLSEISGKSKADFIREAIRMYGNLVQFQHEDNDD